MKLKRVVVTGLGALTPIGNSYPAFREALLQGVNGANPITKFDPEKFKTKFACELKDFDILEFLDKKESRKIDTSSQYALVAATEAIKQSGLLDSDINKERVGVILGTGIGGVPTVMEPLRDFFSSDGTPRFGPFFVPRVMADMMAGTISIQFGFKGPNYATTSACASAANAIIDACHFIQLGKTDVVITGGSEACIIEPVIGGFNSMHALSTRNDDYKTASRPFDLHRDGFVMGEGAAILVLEELEHAKRRGATIYAEIGGTGLSADAYHITAPQPDGDGAMNCMKQAIQDANLQLTDIDHINTHGTSTPPGDLAECSAISNLFGGHTPNILINSTKSMTGHLLGAAAAAEAIATIIAVNEDIVPPTINHFETDPALRNMNIVKNAAMKKTVKAAISNSFGFGGHNASILFKKY
ncbi:beta-ketoacyl-ACP synthase II [Bacteroidales bacterium OttesenSCG-928-B11]|nr:beta-ketoacyl-ACP synthase II [Bacteroidales bacterium OttesenSCG-928-C03]MDL2312504.1 beta-ketoacyl-ACP synthase II [Bacteroidales bacterium OttesenSCG-928-B11]